MNLNIFMGFPFSETKRVVSRARHKLHGGGLHLWSGRSGEDCERTSPFSDIFKKPQKHTMPTTPARRFCMPTLVVEPFETVSGTQGGNPNEPRFANSRLLSTVN
jgi:hypothetical protein